MICLRWTVCERLLLLEMEIPLRPASPNAITRSPQAYALDVRVVMWKRNY